MEAVVNNPDAHFAKYYLIVIFYQVNLIKYQKEASEWMIQK
jgi:hypothetical protein